MKFYSTNNTTKFTSLKEAVLQGLASDNGLYMPEKIPALPEDFFTGIHDLSFRQIAIRVAEQFTAAEIPAAALENIVDHTLQLFEDGKRFKITKEEASSAGIRRIKAVLQ